MTKINLILIIRTFLVSVGLALVLVLVKSYQVSEFKCGAVVTTVRDHSLGDTSSGQTRARDDLGSEAVPEWDKTWDFTDFDNETGTADGRYIVPNFVHFVKFSETSFTFIQAVCVLAAFKHQRPEKLFIHTDVADFQGKYWEVLLNTPGFKQTLVINKMDLPREVFGKPLNPDWVVYHGGDVARLLIMRKYGGIYVDSDSYIIRRLDDLRRQVYVREVLNRYEFVASWRPGKSMMNQVILAHKDARLLKKWQEGYKDYKPDMWFYNAGRQPANVLEEHPYLIHSVPELLGTYDIRSKIYVKNWAEWRNYYSCHLMVRWMNNYKTVKYPNPIGEKDAERYNNTFLEMVRDVYDIH